MLKNFVVSVVVPVYNTEKYLEETLQSVINQTLGFEENIQVVLVNNASEDNAYIICEKYKERYPDNIEYIELKKNVGPSGARNAGILYATGKYINFLDSDDKWEQTAFEKAVNFLEQHEEEIDIACCRVKHFDSTDKWHPLDYKFKGNYVLKVDEKPECFQIFVNSILIKKQVVQNHLFNVEQINWEDFLYTANIILEKKQYGIVSDAIFYYRKRSENDSLSQKGVKDKRFYLEELSRLKKCVCEMSIQKCGEIVPYVGYALAYICHYRFTGWSANFLDESERTIYYEILRDVLYSIDDKCICEHPVIKKYVKIAMLSYKYGLEVKDGLGIKKDWILFRDLPVFTVKDSDIFSIWNIYFDGGKVLLEGRTSFDLPIDYEFILEDEQGVVYRVQEFEWLGCVTRSILSKPYWRLKGCFACCELKNRTQVNLKAFILMGNEKYPIKIEIFGNALNSNVASVLDEKLQIKV